MNVLVFHQHKWACSFNGKTSVSKTEIPRSTRGGPAIIENPRFRRVFLFLGFLMRCPFFAPIAKLLELDLALYLFLVLFWPVIEAFTLRTGQFYKSILGHG